MSRFIYFMWKRRMEIAIACALYSHRFGIEIDFCFHFMLFILCVCALRVYAIYNIKYRKIVRHSHKFNQCKHIRTVLNDLDMVVSVLIFIVMSIVVCFLFSPVYLLIININVYFRLQSVCWRSYKRRNHVIHCETNKYIKTLATMHWKFIFMLFLLCAHTLTTQMYPHRKHVYVFQRSWACVFNVRYTLHTFIYSWTAIVKNQ